MGKYTAIYTHEGDGWWTVRIKEVQGVHSQGRSISQARSRVREALSLFVADADSAEIIDDIRLDSRIRKFITKAELEMRLAENAMARVYVLKQKAARKLVTKMSVRDAGVVLGVSHQRVHQLVKSKARRHIVGREQHA